MHRTCMCTDNLFYHNVHLKMPKIWCSTRLLPGCKNITHWHLFSPICILNDKQCNQMIEKKIHPISRKSSQKNRQAKTSPNVQYLLSFSQFYLALMTSQTCDVIPKQKPILNSKISTSNTCLHLKISTLTSVLNWVIYVKFKEFLKL